MSRKTSFKEQMFRALNSLNRFGQSKYQAKQESYQQGNKGKVEGIYSKKTMQDYKKVAVQFQTWAKLNGYNFHSLSEVSDKHIKQYLTERQADGLSAWTVSHDLSALNKIFHRNISKKETGLQSRRNSDIKNNRGFGNNYRPSVYQKNEALTSFLSATGIRRQSIDRIIQVQDVNIGENIKYYRERAKIKQTDMVKKLQLIGLDISIYSYNRIEKGTQNPTVSFLLAVCSLLDCDMNDLFGMNNNMK